MKYELLCLTCAIIIFAASFYMLVVSYLQETSKMDKQEYDMNTITASDFTVEMNISKEMYQYYLDNEYEPRGKDEIDASGEKYSPALYLKKHLAE